MSTVALLFAQTHEAPPAHLLIVGVLAIVAVVGWLVFRVVRRREDRTSTRSDDGRSVGTDAASTGDDRG